MTILKALRSWIFVGLITMFLGCSQVEANRNPLNESFPNVVGNNLNGEEYKLPESLAGDPAILLVAYKQEAQFDIDRWLMGLIQAGVEVQILEIPTLPGLVPTMASRWIDEGMRSGIPSEDWGIVVTLYGDAAEPVAEFTGTENGRLARVIILDKSGQVIWFDDRGYSVTKALDAAETVLEL